MSRVGKMSLKEILEQTDLIIRENDIVYFCNDLEVINEFMQRFSHQSKKMNDAKQFLVEHSDSIDKEKLMLLIARNYQDNLKMIKKKINQLRLLIRKEQAEEDFKEITKLCKNYEMQKASLEQVLKIGKGMEQYVTFYYYDEEESRNRVEVADSREIIDGKRISKTKNLKRFDEIDLYFRNGNEEDLGMEYILQGILLTDLYRVFPNEAFGNNIRTMILENEIIKRGIKTPTEIRELKCLETYQEYSDLIDSTSFEGMLPDVKETLREYCTYLDIDKLLLIAAYRFHEGLENSYIPTNAHIGAKEILKGILDNLLPNSDLHCELQDKTDNNYEMKQIDYSTQDILTCIHQFTKTRYITNQEIEEYKNQIQSQEINLSQMETGCVEVVFSEQDLEELSLLSEENLIYVLERFDWQNEKILGRIQQRGECSIDLLQILLDTKRLEIGQIIELYEDEIVLLEDLVSMKEKLVSSEETVFQKLDNYYKQTKEGNNNNAEIEKQYKRYIVLYQELFVKGTPEELEKYSNQLIERIIEDYEGQDYLQAIEEYYKNGLLTLNTIAEWNDNDNDIITDLYKDSLITLEDIEELVKARKISSEYLSNIYNSLIYRDDIDYNERLRYIQSGFVEKEDIIDLYQKNLLFEADLKMLVDQGLIRQSEFQRIIDHRTKQDLERNASIKLTGLNTLTKRNNDIYAKGDYGTSSSTRTAPKYIIDPNIREEFIYMLGACRADTDLEEDSPFYHYEFYVIPDESGEIGLNSVVIAERYYEDKMTEERFATKNATYFFKYKDLMVLGNLKKCEMAKEREGIVFTASHTIANEKRDGYWAAGVINSLAKTMLSSSLEDYSRTNRRTIIKQKLKTVYPVEDLDEILEKAIEIDSGRHICEIVEPEKEEKRKWNVELSDDDDAR